VVGIASIPYFLLENLLKIEHLDLHSLNQVGSHLTREICDFFSQAAAVCLDNQNHTSGVLLKIEGDLSAQFQLSWQPVTQQMRDSWEDMQDTTEDGACGLAILTIQKLTEYKVIKRSRKQTGFDYWLGSKEDDNYPFQAKARLEISGILRGGNRQIDQRVKEKREQVKQSNYLKLPAYIVVVEFSTPLVKVVKV
jgi:hypothetical protein